MKRATNDIQAKRFAVFLTVSPCLAPKFTDALVVEKLLPPGDRRAMVNRVYMILTGWVKFGATRKDIATGRFDAAVDRVGFQRLIDARGKAKAEKISLAWDRKAESPLLRKGDFEPSPPVPRFAPGLAPWLRGLV